MKKVFFIGLCVISLLACDPVSDLEANVENLTSQALTIEFISTIEETNKTIEIPAGGITLFQEGFDIGNTFLEPSLEAYDSVLIKNQEEQILKVFKDGDSGKNIYDIDDWKASEPRKRFFKYEYEIEPGDIE